MVCDVNKKEDVYVSSIHGLGSTDSASVEKNASNNVALKKRQDVIYPYRDSG